MVLKIHKHAWNWNTQTKNNYKIASELFDKILLFQMLLEKNIESRAEKKFRIFGQNTWLITCISTICLDDRFNFVMHRLNEIFALIWINNFSCF